MSEKIDFVPGDTLLRVLRHMAAESGDKKVQDTIRNILLADPAVKHAAERFNEDLSQDKPARGGYRRGDKKPDQTDNAADQSDQPAKPKHNPISQSGQWLGRPAPKPR